MTVSPPEAEHMSSLAEEMAKSGRLLGWTEIELELRDRNYFRRSRMAPRRQAEEPVGYDLSRRPHKKVHAALVVDDDVDKSRVHLHPVAIVFDQSEPPELVHEMIDP
jgi:hypothetical protein